VVNTSVLHIMSSLIMDDWQLQISPVVRLEKPSRRFVCGQWGSDQRSKYW